MANMIKYDSLDILDSSKYEWRIKVRVIRVWDSYSTRADKEFKGRNMLLLDDKHNRMHAFIWPNYMEEFKDSLEEGKLYSIRNFAVKTYRKESLRCTKADNQIWFSNYTKVSLIQDDHSTEKMIPQNGFDFFDIGDIPQLIKERDHNYLIDIIGVLKDCDRLRHFTNQKEIEQCSFRFSLTDGSSSIKLCFWDDLAQAFDSELSKGFDAPIVVIVASCKVNEYKCEPYVSNVGATRFYINFQHRSVIRMKQVAAGFPEFNRDKLVQNVTDETQIMTISQIRNLKSEFILRNVMCQVVVRNVQEQQWKYDACSSCQEEVEIINGKYKCEKCKRNIPFPDQRFRLCLVVEDVSVGAGVILFNREVERIIGKTVYDVLTDQQGEGKNEEFPSILKVFEGKQYTITILLTDENINKKSDTYMAIDIYEGFEMTANTGQDDEDLSGAIKFSQSSAQYSTSHSLTKNGLKTPDIEKSVNTKTLKRMNNDSITLITDLDDDNDADQTPIRIENKVPLKQVKKEKT